MDGNTFARGSAAKGIHFAPQRFHAILAEISPKNV
jgi:hypothetical protein